MKQFILKSFVWIAICASLFSFSRIGGDSYTIHLNDRLILQHHVASKNPVPGFSLSQAAQNDQLSVFYSECGQIGKDRKLSVLDEKDNVLTEWNFTNVTNAHAPMTFKAKDVQAFKQKNKVKLVYSSREAPKGRVLATILLTDELKARK